MTNEERTAMLSKAAEIKDELYKVTLCNKLALIDSFLYFFIKFMNYVNMLMVMSFNVGLIMFLCLGLTVGEAIRGYFRDKIYIKL